MIIPRQTQEQAQFNGKIFMKALVTGECWFIGSQLAKELIKQNYEVRGLFMTDEEAQQVEKLGVGIFRGNLTKPDTLRGVAKDIDTVYHLATRTLDWGTHKLFEEIMVDGTQNLLTESSGNISRFIYFCINCRVGSWPGVDWTQ